MLSFLDRVPAIELRDPLAELLGAAAPGERWRYTFLDAVKLCGHSCPTVAGAYLMTLEALRALHPDGAVPERGNIGVVVGGRPDDGTSGPIAQVIGLLTGAAAETGFGGLQGHFVRRDLLAFDPTLRAAARFWRIDTGAACSVVYSAHAVPASPEQRGLMPAVLSGQASAEQRARFGSLWQARVEAILTGDPRRVVSLTPG